VLYRASAMDREAEELLRHAIDLSDRTEVVLPLNALHDLMLAQRRDDEARQYAQLLESARNNDPYYWMGVGLAQLQEGQWSAAVDSLEHASQMVNGFPELHRYLAVAYWRSGKLRSANEQLAVLDSLGDEAAVGGLRSKFKSLTR
jgi:predicted Zn-dependent protease